ncbi:MAG: hypothetical protein U1D30_20170 [Planctomycetota bacterium]
MIRHEKKPKTRFVLAVKPVFGPVMITGDHPETAASNARELGLLGDKGLVLSGTELDQISDEKLSKQVGEIAVEATAEQQAPRCVLAIARGRGCHDR